MTGVSRRAVLFAAVVLLGGCGSNPQDLYACLRLTLDGLRLVFERNRDSQRGRLKQAR